MRVIHWIYGALLLGSAGAVAVEGSTQTEPQHDRQQLQNLYEKEFPGIKLQDYEYGALIFSKDAMEQYKEMMEMPPGDEQRDAGKRLWEAPFKDGKTYADCFPNGGKQIAGNYPYYDEKLHQVVTFEKALNLCRASHGEKDLDYADMKTMGALDLYAESLSDGMKMNVKVDTPAALAAYEKGKRFFYSRRGELNFACATCHVDNAGKRVRNEYLSPVIGQASHWPLFRGTGDLFTLQKRYAACQKMVRAEPLKLGGEEYNDLEYYHAYMSDGLPLQAGVWRK